MSKPFASVFNHDTAGECNKLTVDAMVVGIMVLNFIFMLFAKLIIKPLAMTLAILGAILGIIQVALGAKIIYNSLTALVAS